MTFRHPHQRIRTRGWSHRSQPTNGWNSGKGGKSIIPRTTPVVNTGVKLFRPLTLSENRKRGNQNDDDGRHAHRPRCHYEQKIHVNH